eukprot:g476.t1
MNVSSLIPTLDFVRWSTTSHPSTSPRVARRYSVDTLPLPRRRPRLPVYKSHPRSVQCGCLLEASTCAQETEERVELPPTYVRAKGRVVAIGDLHGDLRKTIRALELAEVVHQDDHGMPVWCGSDSVVVQMGDVLDRGDCEIGILMLLRELHHQAEKQGGAVYMINGNHESLNVCGNFRYVTPGAFYESAIAAGLNKELSFDWEHQLEARMELYSPGGLVACELAKNPTVLVINDTVFAHGGLLPIHVNYGLERVNAEMSAWMRGEITSSGSKATPPYIAMGGSNSILWNRTLAQERFNTPYERYYACSLVKSVLKKLKLKRIVLGHTPQLSGCNCECNGQIWKVDVGMSEGVLNAEPQLITIEEDQNGNTLVEIVHSKSCSLPHSYITKRNNIQTTVQMGSISVKGSIKWMSKRLISRLIND